MTSLALPCHSASCPAELLQHLLQLQTSDGQLNWGLIMFTMLCLACGSVWLSLVHSWRAIGRSCWGARDKKSKAQFMTINDMKQPLLDKNDLEVAAKHAGAQNVVCLSYEPLKSEERPAYQAP